jgi:hypothetical protein
MKRTLLSALLTAAAMWTGVPAQAATLVNEWKFEGNTSDTSGNNNHGTVTGSPSYVAGKFGQAINLNRADAIQKTGATGLPVSGTASWSINLWLYLTSTPDSLAYLAGFGNNTSAAGGGTARGLLAFGNPGNQGIYSWGSSKDLASGSAYPLNQWTMVTITHDGASGTRTIWVNGAYVISGVQTLSTCPGTVAAGVVAWSGRDWQGILDEFSVWSGMLSTDDIAGLYASNSVPTTPPTIVSAPQPATGYPGEYADLSVVADGSAPLAYQWLKGGAPVPGATTTTLAFAPLKIADAGDYAVVVSNSVGSATSSPPTAVTVLAVPNIATALAAYWPFDETSGSGLADVTGHGNDGMLVNFLGDGSERVAGKLANALHFRGPGTGLNDYVTVAADNIRPARTLTIATWIWVDAISTWASIIKNWPADTANGQVHFGMNSTDGDLSNYLIDGAGTFTGPVREGLGNLMPLGQWVHVALVCNGQTMQLYRNGAPSGSPLPYSGSINTNTLGTSLSIGAKLGAGGLPYDANVAYWKGSMDDMGFWTRGLAPGEILAIFVAGQAGHTLTNADAYTGLTLPLITGQPQGATKFQGEYKAQFSVQAVGQGALSYQWRAEGTPVSDATDNVLNLYGPLTNSVSYTVVVTDAGNGNSITSSPALLNILPVTSITNALAGYWNLDETTGMTAADSTPNARPATLNNYWDDSMWVPGQIGGSLAFGGAGYAQYASVANIVVATNNTLTVSAWVWADAEDDRAAIVDCYGENPIGQFRFGLSSAAARPLTGGVISQAAGYVAGTEATGFPTGSWQHVALVADGATLRLYRNGSLSATNAYNGTIVFPSAITNLFLGARLSDDGTFPNTTPGYWTGKLDDLGVWSRGLTADEVLGIYAAGFSHQPLTTASGTGVRPIISTPPTSLTVTEGDDASFTVAATGVGTLSYQWRKDGVPIPGATTTSYALHSVVPSDAADYAVVVSNFVGSVTSAPAATLTVNPLPPLPPMTSDLVAWWKFDDATGTNALDSAGGNPAELLNYPGSSASWVAGILGGALTFDGFSQFGYLPDYPKPTTNMTVAGWVWASAAPTWASILKNWGGSLAGEFHFGLQDGEGDLSIYIQQASGSVVSTREGVPLPLGSWQHVAFVCDGALVRLYHNGIQVASVPYDGTLQSAPAMNCLGIGAKLDNACGGLADTGSPGYWVGSMDDLGLWVRGLASVEIQALYSSGLDGRNTGLASLAPTLRMQRAGADWMFSWPEAPLGRGFVLESTPGLLGGSWTPVGVALTVSNGRCSVTVPTASAGDRFYRLRQ